MHVNRNIQKYAKSNPGLLSEKLFFFSKYHTHTNFNTITVVKIQEHHGESKLIMSIY